jgi:hypothetical protein
VQIKRKSYGRDRKESGDEGLIDDNGEFIANEAEENKEGDEI